MPRYPAAVDLVGTVPPANYHHDTSPKIGFVVHVVQGSAQSAIAEFQNPNLPQGEEVSAHFVCSVTGTVWQLLDTSDDAYAQADGNYPPTAYIACEFEGYDTGPMTASQITAGAKLLAWCAATHGFPLVAVDHGAPGVTTHCHYPSGVADPSWGNHPCPGLIRLGQVPALIAAAKPAPKPPAPTYLEGNMICQDPTSGGTWAVSPIDGHVEASNGAPYLGGLNPDQHNWKAIGKIAGIAPYEAGGAVGYRIGVLRPVAVGGEFFTYYGFPRDGSAK